MKFNRKNSSLSRKWGPERRCFSVLGCKIREIMVYLYADGIDPGERGELLEG